MSTIDPFFEPYTLEWYRAHAEGKHFEETMHVGEGIFAVTQPTRVLDVGCGVGTMLWAIYKAGRGGVECHGIEAPHALDLLAGKGILPVPEAWIHPFDLRVLKLDPTARMQSDPPGARFDLVISVEVAEHLPPEMAGRFVRFLCAHSDMVVFSAAVPGQGGEGHLNEQDPGFWAGEFRLNGFELDEDMTNRLLNGWIVGQVPTVPWYEGIRVYRYTAGQPLVDLRPQPPSEIDDPAVVENLNGGTFL
jgi:SAM-dependent methyltransferase